MDEQQHLKHPLLDGPMNDQVDGHISQNYCCLFLVASTKKVVQSLP